MTVHVMMIQEPTAKDFRAKPYRLNTIDSHSKFKDIDVSKMDLRLQDDQIRAGRIMISGWKQNGPWPNAEFWMEDGNGERVN